MPRAAPTRDDLHADTRCSKRTEKRVAGRNMAAATAPQFNQSNMNVDDYINDPLAILLARIARDLSVLRDQGEDLMLAMLGQQCATWILFTKGPLHDTS